MQFEKKLWNNNGVPTLGLPSEVATWLGLEAEDTIIIQDEEGKNGRYISIWKKIKGGK